MTSLQNPPSPLHNLSPVSAAPSFYVCSQLVDSGVEAYFNGEYELALKSFATALKTQQLTLGEVDIVVAHTLQNISSVYISLGMLDEGIQVLQECLSMKMQLRADSNVTLPQGYEVIITSDTLKNLGSLYFLKGEYFDSMSYFQNSLKELIEGPVPGSKSEISDALYNIGNVHCHLGEYDDALMAMAESLQLIQSTLAEGVEDPRAAEVMEKIGAIYLQGNRLDDAMTAFLESLAITKTALGSDHVDCAGSVYNVGLVYERKGEIRRAIEAYKSALQIFQRNGVEDDTSVEMVRQRLMNINVPM